MGDHYPRVWKPVIAAVNGWAAGRRALHPARPRPTSASPAREHARFKFALTDAGLARPRAGRQPAGQQLRYIDAMKILLTDEPVDAAEALRIGLVNEVVPHAQLMERAEKIARHIVTMPPVAVRMMKEFVVRFGDLPTDQAWHVQNLINNLLIQMTTDGEEGRRRSTKSARPTSPARCAAAARRGRNRRRRTPSASTRPIAAASSRRSLRVPSRSASERDPRSGEPGDDDRRPDARFGSARSRMGEAASKRDDGSGVPALGGRPISRFSTRRNYFLVIDLKTAKAPALPFRRACSISPTR